MAIRIKLKCPTCWAETYIRVEDDEIESERIDEVHEEHNYRGTNHDRPVVERREAIAE